MYRYKNNVFTYASRKLIEWTPRVLCPSPVKGKEKQTETAHTTKHEINLVKNIEKREERE